MTLTQMRVLDAVARHGHVTRAAEELMVTQPAVSHALRSLEKELGTKLVSRTPDGVALTSAGQVAARRAAAILNQVEGLHQELAVAAGRHVGTLRVGAFPSVTARLLPPIISSFRKAYPGVTLALLEGSDGELLDWIRTGAVDVATVTARKEGLQTTRLARDRMLALVPRQHPLAGRTAIALAEIGRDPFILSTGGCEPLIREIARRAGVSLRCHYEVRDSASILAMVREGLGVSLMPELAISRPTDVVAIDLDPGEHRDVFLAVPADAEPLPTALAFIECAVNAVRESGTDFVTLTAAA
jgi:DNA-binding transcriptional LysR family regulator